MAKLVGAFAAQFDVTRSNNLPQLDDERYPQLLPYLTFSTFCIWAFCVETKVPTTWGTHQDIIATLILLGYSINFALNPYRNTDAPPPFRLIGTRAHVRDSTADHARL